MDMIKAVVALSALAQPTRLAVFRLLVQAGQTGMAAGEIAAALNVRQNTMSTNLLILVEAGLARNSRDGRTIRYTANLDGTRQLLGFLVQDCCGGRPELCQPLMDQIACPC